MSTMTIKLTQETEVSESAANQFLAADGLLNFTKVQALQARVAKSLKGSEATKVLATYVMKRRAKPVPYKAASEQKGDLKYRAARATKIYERKRLKPEALARVAVLLQITDDPKFVALFKQARSAMAQHMKRTEKHVEKIGKEKAKIRDARNAEFEESVGILRDDLINAGFKETDLVESQGMMGKTVILRLSPNNYVAISPADKARFSAAVKASKGA